MTEGAIEFRRRTLSVMPTLGMVAAGAVCGVAAKVADGSGVRWLADLGTYPAAWMLSGAAIGRFAPTVGQGALRSAAFFVSMCLAYYGWAILVLGFPRGPQLYSWLALSVTAAPVLGAASWWATRQGGPVGGAVMATAAATALSDGSVRQLWLGAAGQLPEGFPLRPGQAVFDVIVALTIALVLPRRPATRVWAGVLLIPMTLVAGRLVDRLMGFLL
jgi:hypothetical protein